MLYIIVGGAAGGAVLLLLVAIVIIICCCCCCRKGKSGARPMKKMTTLIKKVTFMQNLVDCSSLCKWSNGVQGYCYICLMFYINIVFCDHNNTDIYRASVEDLCCIFVNIS